MELNLEQLKEVRKLTIIALFSDDDLMETLVLKGGNALEIGYGLNSRASIDVDVSMIQEFEVIGLEETTDLEAKLDKVLNKAFEPTGYRVFDVKVKAKPKKLNEKNEDFWGGYEANFKIIEANQYEKYEDNPVALGAKAIATNKGKKNVKIDFGRFEYCGSTINKEIDGFDIQIYTPELILFEKLRAICQQMPTYLESIGKSHDFGRPRPRDFYDIYTILESDKIPDLNLKSEENIEHMKKCFEAKRVPLELLAEIINTRDFHKQEEAKLKDSILNKAEYKGFDYYFDYVQQVIGNTALKPEVI
ncbi:nucleotidyl transferase AbiEii/AbiGii toxin family protein [Neobacillus niacini]|uniref:nucleotidyl transferase AbiEii/AbiGii toxin family protein n=1 Tax=Neobacillus niacini TaxID=86668 RepID=UPI0007ABB04C|nr:nucleotidyl transferase AbiEii/AbiGii toxin family protein [Neobacillus niacini]MEC1524451.1 nucleotidyl transferase AbiEii/AbiGii toxin family protein [Neobacillus niacini]